MLDANHDFIVSSSSIFIPSEKQEAIPKMYNVDFLEAVMHTLAVEDRNVAIIVWKRLVGTNDSFPRGPPDPPSIAVSV